MSQSRWDRLDKVLENAFGATEDPAKLFNSPTMSIFHITRKMTEDAIRKNEDLSCIYPSFAMTMRGQELKKSHPYACEMLAQVPLLYGIAYKLDLADVLDARANRAKLDDCIRYLKAERGKILPTLQDRRFFSNEKATEMQNIFEDILAAWLAKKDNFARSLENGDEKEAELENNKMGLLREIQVFATQVIILLPFDKSSDTKSMHDSVERHNERCLLLIEALRQFEKKGPLSPSESDFLASFDCALEAHKKMFDCKSDQELNSVIYRIASGQYGWGSAIAGYVGAGVSPKWNSPAGVTGQAKQLCDDLGKVDKRINCAKQQFQGKQAIKEIQKQLLITVEDIKENISSTYFQYREQLKERCKKAFDELEAIDIRETIQKNNQRKAQEEKNKTGALIRRLAPTFPSQSIVDEHQEAEEKKESAPLIPREETVFTLPSPTPCAIASGAAGFFGAGVSGLGIATLFKLALFGFMVSNPLGWGIGAVVLGALLLGGAVACGVKAINRVQKNKILQTHSASIQKILDDSNEKLKAEKEIPISHTTRHLMMRLGVTVSNRPESFNDSDWVPCQVHGKEKKLKPFLSLFLNKATGVLSSHTRNENGSLDIWAPITNKSCIFSQ